jgi:hypothetical protein
MQRLSKMSHHETHVINSRRGVLETSQRSYVIGNRIMGRSFRYGSEELMYIPGIALSRG